MTMLTTTYPLARAESRPLPATTENTWGFWATLGWFGAAVASHFAVVILFGLGFMIWWLVNRGNLDVGTVPPTLEYIIIVLSMLAPALLLTLAARRAGPSAQGYLGLTMPAKRHILIGVGLTAAYWCMGAVFFHLFPAFDQTPELIREYRSLIGNPSALTMYWITMVVSAPVLEEIIFRGFLMRGWSETRLGAVGAIVLSSLLFAAIHQQYTLLNIGFVLLLGLLLGVMRWRSGSTVLTIMLHAAWNFTSVTWFALQA